MHSPLSRSEMGGRKATLMEREAQSVRAQFTGDTADKMGDIRRRHEREIHQLRRAGVSNARIEAAQANHAEEIRTAKAQAGEGQRRLGHTVAVKGRQTSRGVVWDIFQLDGARKPKLVRAGFTDPNEAVIVAGDVVRGRMSVSFAGARRVFARPDKSRSLLIPDSGIDIPGQQGVKVVKVGDDLLLSTK